MFALDFVSLLLSKDQPVQASSTISPFLRDAVPVGTLGMDKVQASRLTEAERLDNKRIAKGWKIQNLNKAVDSILASATRLEKEMEKETRYWEQVLAISGAGWSLCRLPNERHTLGVRFGFAEGILSCSDSAYLVLTMTAAPAFKSRSLAAVRRNTDGTIYLDQGISDSEPRALRVRIRSTSINIGSSTLPLPPPDDAPIESLILQARNTVFSSELWQELNREARTLGSFGVRTKDDTLICPLTPSKTIIIDLVPLGDSAPRLPRPDDKIAEGICLALHLLLSCAHRQNHRRRTQPPPPISNQNRLLPPYNLLRPLITRLNHQSAVSSVHSLLKPLCAVLASTKITPQPTYEIISTPPPASFTNTLSATESVILSLTDRLEATTTFKITDTTSIIIKSRTTLFPVAGTMHFLTLSPESPLNTICKAPIRLEYWNRVEEYILYATSCALGSSFTRPFDPNKSGYSDASEADAWQLTTQPNILRKAGKGDGDVAGKSKQLIFQTQMVNGTAKVQVKWEFISTNADYPPILGKARGAKKGEGMYEWRANGNASNGLGNWDEGEGEVIRSLDEVVHEAQRS
jgi:mediator of RNA polymerase II transcription subunit 17